MAWPWVSYRPVPAYGGAPQQRGVWPEGHARVGAEALRRGGAALGMCVRACERV